jgi:4-aminobutyrate aminotransferase-like enzyme
MTDTKSAMIERRRNLLGAAYELFYDDPVHIVNGDGVWLYDADGKRYLDMYNNVPHVGHCHPHVVEAVSRQIATLNTHTRYLHDNILDYAERLTGKFEEELSRDVLLHGQRSQ